jgi:type II secretory pathway component PulM
MKEWQVKLKEWWQKLSLREQQTVAFGSVVVGAFMFYMLIWGPYLERIDLLRKQIQSEQKTLAWMQAADSEIKKIEEQTKNKNAATTPVAMLSYLQKQIEQAKLNSALTGLKQVNNDAIELHFQKVEFDGFMRLLMLVLSTQNVTVTQLAVLADNTPGIVNADLMLKI